MLQFARAPLVIGIQKLKQVNHGIVAILSLAIRIQKVKQVNHGIVAAFSEHSASNNLIFIQCYSKLFSEMIKSDNMVYGPVEKVFIHRTRKIAITCGVNACINNFLL